MSARAGNGRRWWLLAAVVALALAAVVSFYASGDPALSTLQYELQKLLTSSMNAGMNSVAAAGNAAAGGQVTTPIALRSAITMVAAVPILFVYPFLQKHFVSGLTIGSVKG